MGQWGCALGNGAVKLCFSLRNGQWGKCREGGWASEDPAEATDPNSSGAAGKTHIHTHHKTHTTHTHTH